MNKGFSFSLILAFFFALVFILATSFTTSQPVNTTSPVKTCPWVNLNQEQIIGSNKISKYPNYELLPSNNTFLVPNNVLYSNVTIMNGGVVASCASNATDCLLQINDVTCGTVPTNATKNVPLQYYEFSTECLSEIKEGINTISVSGNPQTYSARIESVSLHMKLIPVC